MARHIISVVLAFGVVIALQQRAFAQSPCPNGDCIRLCTTLTDGTNACDMTQPAGSFTVGNQTLMVDESNPPDLGDIATDNGDGTFTLDFPLSGSQASYFPPTFISSPLGPIEVDISVIGDPVSGGDGFGLLDTTGATDTTADLWLRINLGSPLPAGCGLTVHVQPTTGTDGSLTGVAYSLDPVSGLGFATFVENHFSAPPSDGCGVFGPTVDGLIGLPSASGNNSANLPTTAIPGH